MLVKHVNTARCRAPCQASSCATTCSSYWAPRALRPQSNASLAAKKGSSNRPSKVQAPSFRPSPFCDNNECAANPQPPMLTCWRWRGRRRRRRRGRRGRCCEEERTQERSKRSVSGSKEAKYTRAMKLQQRAARSSNNSRGGGGGYVYVAWLLLHARSTSSIERIEASLIQQPPVRASGAGQGKVATLPH